MIKALWLGTLVGVCVLCPDFATADQLGGGCTATAQNATYQLQKASGNADQALKDWLHYCSPDADTIVRYTKEIQKAKGGADAQPSAPSAGAQPAPSPKSKPAPFGTFAQYGRLNYNDRSGYFDWDDALVIREDGTAEMTTKYKESLFPGWHLRGCDRGQQAGSALLFQKFTVEVNAAIVSLRRQGPIEVSRVEPSCWTLTQSNVESIFQDPWVLDWVDGRLKNQDGEYYRQD